jgi:hypothetical protein
MRSGMPAKQKVSQYETVGKNYKRPVLARFHRLALAAVKNDVPVAGISG